jgi:hypothetical protein
MNLTSPTPLLEQGIDILDASRSSISDQQHPIADLEHPFALINTSFIAKGCSKLRINAINKNRKGSKPARIAKWLVRFRG